MDAPLWTSKHAPSIDDIRQDTLRNTLTNIDDGPVNLLLYGPPGSGKTATARALAHDLHDNPDADLIMINVSDFFDMTKKEIASDPRFESFIDSKRRRNSSKADLINHVLKESASYQPMSGSFKTIVLDNAEDIRMDFQQALRRVMERHHATTQFVLTTRQPATIIPALKSRCLPVSVTRPSTEELVDLLAGIADAEDVDYTDDGLEYITAVADGNIRKSILILQTTAGEEDEVTMNAVYSTMDEVDLNEQVKDMLDEAEARNLSDARDKLDTLLEDDQYTGYDVLTSILDVAETRYRDRDHANVAKLAADIEVDLNEGLNDRIHLANFLAQLPTVTAN